MPVIGISVARLSRHLGVDKTVDQLVDILESLGCDVEDAAHLALYDCPACAMTVEVLKGDEAPTRCGHCGHAREDAFAAAGEDEVVRLDLLPDRPDLFDPGGLARAIKGFLGLDSGLPAHHVEPGELVVKVDPDLSNADSYRPFIACAEVTLETPIDSDQLRDLMKLQENLHWAIGRDRKLASIGVYDLAPITGPIAYRAVGKDELGFCPLGMPGREMTPAQIFAEHPKGTGYAHLLAEHAKVPLLIDSQGQVLSMPPIINSEETRLRVGSRHLFVDVTGITRADVDRALNTLVASLIEQGGTVRSVHIQTGDGRSATPQLEPRTIELSLPETNRWLGTELDAGGLTEIAGRMRLGISGGPETFDVLYPAYRCDVKHPVDLMEDVAIGFGYKNFDLALVPTATTGDERPEERLASRVRSAMLGIGYDEVMTLFQVTEAIHYGRLRMTPDPHCVRIANPKSTEHDRIRTHLLSGLLELLEKNRRKPAPLRLFEVANVVLLDGRRETGTREVRRLAFAVMGPEAGYAEVRGVCDGLLHELGWTGTYAPVDHPSCIPGRVAELTLEDGRTGTLGELHPEVILAFGLPYPVAICELDLIAVI